MKPDKGKDRKNSSESSTRYTVSRLEFIRLKLHRGDKKVIAEILNLHPEWVSQVIRGKGNSEVILEEAERIILQREAAEKEQIEDEYASEKKRGRKRKHAADAWDRQDADKTGIESKTTKEPKEQDTELG